MTREIKFRAWLKEEQRMVEVDNISFERRVIDYSFPSTVVEADEIYTVVEYGDCYFRSVELMQYIGFKDKNGKEIYEGDIVETIGHNSTKTLEIVKYSEGCFNVGYHCGSSTKRSPMLLHSKKIKVIGNIYENADLLEEEVK